MFAALITLACFLSGLFCLILDYFRIILILKMGVFICGWLGLTALLAMMSILYYQRKKLIEERIAKAEEAMDQDCYHFQFDTGTVRKLRKINNDDVIFDDSGCGCEMEREYSTPARVIPND